MADIEGEELRQIVAAELKALTRDYFTWALANVERERSEARLDHELSSAEYARIAQILRTEAQRRGVDLGPSLPATARARKAAKGKTGPQSGPTQVKCSPRKRKA
jgi:predicted trehalose synthase